MHYLYTFTNMKVIGHNLIFSFPLHVYNTQKTKEKYSIQNVSCIFIPKFTLIDNDFYWLHTKRLQHWWSLLQWLNGMHRSDELFNNNCKLFNYAILSTKHVSEMNFNHVLPSISCYVKWTLSKYFICNSIKPPSWQLNSITVNFKSILLPTSLSSKRPFCPVQ